MTTNYDYQAHNFAKLPDYSLHCGTDFLAVKDIPKLIKKHGPVHKILDLGCGSGLATRFLKKYFPDTSIIGADINKRMLEQATPADPNGLYVHLPNLDRQIIYPFLPNFFDVITCSFVIHENKTMDELKEFIKHIANLLRPGGLFYAWDVSHQLFQGKWVSIKTESLTSDPIKNGESYTLKILPAEAEVTGTFWSPETISAFANAFDLKTNQILYPLAEANDELNWLDETRLAPYFVIEAQKET